MSTNIGSIREIILDTETTGIDPLMGHRIVEIGAIEMRNKVLTGEKFHCYIDPERDMPDDVYRIHGISGEFLKGKPKFADIVEEFTNFIGDSKLVIHNAPFDIKFLNHELSLLGKPSLELDKAIDTLIIARKKFPGMRNNLDALCKRFGVDNSARTFHGALRDAALLAEVYVELMGGRQASFDMVKAQDKYSFQKIQVEDNRVEKKTIVVMPTKEELKNHQMFLAQMSKTGMMN